MPLPAVKRDEFTLGFGEFAVPTVRAGHYPSPTICIVTSTALPFSKHLIFMIAQI